jgi:S1-C subfamily serine protease
VIVGIDGNEWVHQFGDQMAKTQPGQEIALTIYRRGKEVAVTVRLGRKP